MKSNNVICCILNLAPHYRATVYRLIDKELKCDFYIGDRVQSVIKIMDYNTLQGFKKMLRYIPLVGNFYWQKGIFHLFFKPYKKYLITGEVYCVSTWLFLALAKLFSKEIYLWSHGWYGNESRMKRLIKKLFFQLSTHIFLYGDYARRLMEKQGISSMKLSCIYNSLDYDYQMTIRNTIVPAPIFKNYFKNENPVLLYIGRLQKVKRIDLLIRALKVLNEKSVNCNLLIVGEEIEDFGLKDLVRDLKLENQIWLYGSCYEEEKIGNFFYNADICVSPGNVGLTAIHSLTYGCPVITHNNFCNQMPEFEVIKNGETGMFFKENDVEDLANTIMIWLKVSKNKREEIRSKCYAIIDEKYNPHYQIKVFKNVFMAKM